MADIGYGSLPFSEQVAFFRRKVNVPTRSWLDLWQEAHDHAFMVAGANRLDLVEDFRKAVDAAIADGETLQQFRKRFDAIVAKYGWDYNGGRNWRSRVIYETNMRTSYAAGRWAQLQSIKDRVPYWEYVHADGEKHPRPMHLSWDGLVLDADDAWWETHFPPGGWGCQCTVRGRSKRDLAEMGKAGPDQAPPTDMVDVTVGKRSPGGPRVVQTPEGIDPGFGYAPGRDAWMRAQAVRSIAVVTAEEDTAWESLVRTTFEDLLLPALLPGGRVAARLAPADATPVQVVRSLRQAIGAEAKVYDVHGVPVLVDADALGPVLAGRGSEWLAHIPDALTHPQEVWTQIQRDPATGALRTVTRIFKAYETAAGRVVLMLEERDGVLVSWRVVLPGEDPAALNAERRGMLWWSQD